MLSNLHFVLFAWLLMGLWSQLSWIHICLMCNPLVSSSLCPTMLKGQWLNHQSWIQSLDYGWGFSILNEKVNEYNKLVEIAMVEVLGFVEDERTFNNLSFMKNKLWNQLTTHLNLCVKMFSHNFFTLSNFPYDDACVMEGGDNEVSGWIVDLISGFRGFCSSCRLVYVKSLADLVWVLG